MYILYKGMKMSFSISFSPKFGLSVLLNSILIIAVTTSTWQSSSCLAAHIQNYSLYGSHTPTCSVPHDELMSGRFVDGNAPRIDLSFPSWANYALMRRGQLFAQDNWFSVLLAASLGRMPNMNYPDIQNVAMFVKTMSDSPPGCARILSSFGAKVLTWFQDLQFLPPIIPANSDFLESVNRIRWIHIKVARDIGQFQRHTGHNAIVDDSKYDNVPTDDNIWDAFHKDLTASDIPPEQRLTPSLLEEGNSSIPYFNQHSLAYFQFNAFAYPIIMGERFGIMKASGDDLFAFNHLSAVILYTFGVDDKFNIALQPNISSLKEYYWKVFNESVIPSLFHVNKRTKVTIENILKGTRLNVPAWTLQLYLYRVATMLAKVPAPNLAALFNDQDKYHDNNLRTNVLPKLGDPLFRFTTNTKSISDLITVGKEYYGQNYSKQYNRARYAFLTPIRNE